MSSELQTNDKAQAYVPATASEAVQLFDLAQREAKAWASCSIVPKAYQGNIPNCMVALDVARRLGASPVQVMQNLYVVHGTPSWSSTFLIAAVNHCGRYGSLRYEERGDIGSEEYAVRAYAFEKSSGDRLDGTWITWKMVKAEGWMDKAGSKWKTMPEQMFKYRAAAFWQRTYAPEIGMGFRTVDEVEDIGYAEVVDTKPVRLSPKQMAELSAQIAKGEVTMEEVSERFPTLAQDQIEQLATVNA